MHWCWCLDVVAKGQQVAAEHWHMAGGRVHRVHYDTDSLHQSLSTSALHTFTTWWLIITRADYVCEAFCECARVCSHN